MRQIIAIILTFSGIFSIFYLNLVFSLVTTKRVSNIEYNRISNTFIYSSTQLSAKAKAFGSKSNEIFYCDNCGMEHVKWVGRCTSCKEWNTVKEFKQASLKSLDSIGPAARAKSFNSNSNSNSYNRNVPWIGSGNNQSLIPMEAINIDTALQRINLFSSELNRVLGNGLVKGSVVLLAGEPGIGKSTLLLQLASSIANGANSVVYLSGEENPEQIAARAHRLDLNTKNIFLICDVNLDNAINNIISMSNIPSLVIVDSVQTMRTENCNNGIGSVTQIRECTAQLVQLAKSYGCAVLLVGHVTKTGEVAGPRVLEHMVDTVLYMEGNEKADYRMLRSIKNRFGNTNEVGVFSMHEKGLIDVANPSELFMSNNVISEGVEGSGVAVIMEGTRPIIAEIQCLVTTSYSKIASPRRTSDGFPIQRLLLIIAVIEKRLKFNLYNKDIYLNVVGGLRVTEPSADLAVAMIIISSLLGEKMNPGVAFIGEIGLSGELRGGKRLESRIQEAIKMGFTKIIIPTSTSSSREGNNRNGKSNVVYCAKLQDVMKEALNINDAKLAQIDSKQGKGPVKSYKKQGKAWFSSEPQIDDEGAMEDDEIVTYSDDY